MSFISCLLRGGLGNQLFIIFCTLSYAIDNNLNFKIIVYDCPRFYWNLFLKEFSNNIDYVPNNRNISIYNENGFHYTKIPNQLINITLSGYFQSYNYFEHNLNKILEIMNFKQKQDIIKEKYKHFFTKKTLVVHFRMGDYLNLQDYHCIKRPNYYKDAFNKFIELLDSNDDIYNYNILYFCQEQDDIIVSKYIEEIKHTIINLNFIKVDNTIVDWEQLLIMTLCDNFIIANSTFSWFGAYLSNNINKIVIYPSKWFGPKLNHHNTTDLFKDNWIKIDG